MNAKPSTLRDFVVQRMDDLNLSQTDLTHRSGLSISDINGIVQGRIKLPRPDKRRPLAKALAVSHLDLLVAAGEITKEEIGEAGAIGIIEHDPDSPRGKLLAMAKEMPDQRVPFAIRQLELTLESRQTQW